jgi:hypothetical protein
VAETAREYALASNADQASRRHREAVRVLAGLRGEPHRYAVAGKRVNPYRIGGQLAQ